MKKKVIVLVIIAILLILLIPIPRYLNDGGTVEYKAVLYCISKVHSFTSEEIEKKTGEQYNEGIIVKILNFEVFNNVKSDKITNKQNINNLNESENYQKYSKTIDNIRIEVSIPNEWKYIEIPKNEDNDFYKYALKFYKNDEKQYAMLYFYCDRFGVCGTGRTDENITLDNGKEATVGYYDGNNDWSDISFYSMNKKIALINYGLINVEADEIIEFIKTMNIIENI